ncbi:MAG: hypothetical protein KAT65_29500 [Methanophagales archaeon]|nr:hypothetical protein [Methanophagales archaeon]
MTTMIIRRVSGVLVIAVFLLSMASTVTAQSLALGQWDETAKKLGICM